MWQIMGINFAINFGLFFIGRIIVQLEKEAAETPGTADDELVRMLKFMVDFLKQPEIVNTLKKSV